ncbi:molecular chaperone [Paraburkholderia caribensis MBA4]|uniref:Molecular chaperone n=1 Tax=Paraburkholderia caribensis MBA4 TaxID=1323664 RepID=A0A0P0RJK6_9BURK|nr:molecular chaperone [Paraburkholderia caribensis MBA4]
MIRAAFRALSQKYHPDRNGARPDYQRVMTIINTSYDILKDPALRTEHDQWIVEKEQDDEMCDAPLSPDDAVAASSGEESVREGPGAQRGLLNRMISRERLMVVICICVGVVSSDLWRWGANSLKHERGDANHVESEEKTNNAPLDRGARMCSQSDETEYSAAPAWKSDLEKSRFIGASPEEKQVGQSAGYLEGGWTAGYKGHASLMIDNTESRVDTLVSLVATGGVKEMSVRQLFMPAGRKFLISDIQSGQYKIQIKPLENHGFVSSKVFDLESQHAVDDRGFVKLKIRSRTERGKSVTDIRISD